MPFAARPLHTTARRPRPTAVTRSSRALLLGIATLLAQGTALPQDKAAPKPAPPPPDPAIVDATHHQLDNVQHRAAHLSYQMRRQDRSEDVTRLLIESVDGTVSRLIQRDGKPLAAAEDSREQGRLRHLDAGDMAHKRKSEREGEKFATELISAMPQAMLYTPTAGQPQLPLLRPQLVFDFTANPAYHASTTSQGLLAGLEGRIWIDRDDHNVVRIEVRVVHDLNLAWGLLAKVYKGGTLEYDQRMIAPGQYAYTHIAIDVTLRELMVKTVPYRLQMTASDHRILPSPPPNLQQAVQQLLSIPVPTTPEPAK